MEEDKIPEKKFYQQNNFWLGAGAALILFLVFSLGGKVLENSSLARAFGETLSDVFGLKSEKPIYEVDLRSGEARDFRDEAEIVPLISPKTNKNSDNSASVQDLMASVAKKSSPKTTSEEKVSNSKLKEAEVETKAPSKTLPDKKEEKIQIKECEFSEGGGADGRIYFNEIAWMGGLNSASDEWVEIKNNSGAEINLQGWQIKNQSEKIKIVFESELKISSQGFLVFERTDDNSISNVTADKIYSGALSNENEWLKLFDADCNLVDEVNAAWGWGKFGGDNVGKKTLERNLNDAGWHTSSVAGGTPKAKNSEPVLVSGGDSEEEESTPPPNSGGSGGSNENAPPPAPQNPAAMKILISEVMAGSSASADDEFIEIYNYGSEAADLTGWTIKKKTSSGAESSLVSASRLNGKVVPPGKYLLLNHEGGYTGATVGDVTWPSSYSLAYTNNSITIYSASGGVVDQVTWIDIPKDKSYSRSSLDVSAGFGVTDSPSPTNSQ